MEQVYLLRDIDFKKMINFVFDLDNTLVQYTANYRSLMLEKYAVSFRNQGICLPLESLAMDGIGKHTALDIETGHIVYIDANNRITGSLGLENIAESNGNGKELFTGNVAEARERFRPIDNVYRRDDAIIYNVLTSGGTLDASVETFQKLRHVINIMHANGSIKNILVSEPESYIDFYQPETISFLQFLKEQGKRLFIITNTEPEFINVLLRTVTDGNRTLRDYFYDEHISAGNGQKPNIFKKEFFEGLSRRWVLSRDNTMYIGDCTFSDVVAPSKYAALNAYLVEPDLSAGTDSQLFRTNIGTASKFARQLQTRSAGFATYVHSFRSIDVNASYAKNIILKTFK